MNECENVRRSYSSIVGISSEVLRVLLGVVLPLRALVIHRVLQAVPVFVIGGVTARVQSQGHPFSCKYLRAGKCPHGLRKARVRSQGHPFSCKYWRTGKCPLWAAKARVRVPRAPVLVQVLESGQVSISRLRRARVHSNQGCSLAPTSAVLHSPGEQRSRIRRSQLHQEVQRLSRRVETELRRCPSWL